jgi:hypothetical protein
MAARQRAGRKLATTETRDGNVPEILQLAVQLLAEQQADISKLQTWRRARSERKPADHRSPGSAHLPGHQLRAVARPDPFGELRARASIPGPSFAGGLVADTQPLTTKSCLRRRDRGE